jgi:aminomuconate-semialdehyde/2-hydroxymuconate-6-semialdehyde dehydrogenase
LTTSFLLPAALSSLRNYVDGEFVCTDRRFDNVSPLTGKVLAQVHEADAALVDRAVQAARKALSGPWGRMTVDERAKMLHRVADIMERRFDEFVAAEVADTGRPVEQAKVLDVYRGIANLRTFADLGKVSHGDCFETHLVNGQNLVNYTVRKPIGVVASICPWNLPLLSMTWKAGPALICGNTMVVKPSEETPSSATLLAEAFHEAGVPPGVFNLVHGFGPGSAGEAMTKHPGVDAVTFTGESRTGTTIMKAVADSMKEISFELGGKNAAVVFADADFEAAVEGVVRSSFSNSGQVCLCSERVFVERPIFEKFVAAMKAKTEALTIGWPDEPGVFMGRSSRMRHRDKVLSYFELAVEEGPRW